MRDWIYGDFSREGFGGITELRRCLTLASDCREQPTVKEKTRKAPLNTSL